MNQDKNNQQHLPIQSGKPARFISLRWRFLTPFYFAMLLVTMVGAFVVARNLSGGLEVSQTNVLLQSSRSVQERAEDLFRYHYSEAQRVAFTNGVPDAVLDGDAGKLEPTLEALLTLSGLDSIIVTGTQGQEIIGILRIDDTFAISNNADLTGLPVVNQALNSDVENAAGFMTTSSGVLLYTGVPIFQDGDVVGAVLVGQRLDSVLRDLKQSAVADLVLYGADSNILDSTFDPSMPVASLQITEDLFAQTLNSGTTEVPLDSMTLSGVPYNGAYRVFSFGGVALGAVGVYVADDLPFITEMGRQLVAVGAAVIVGVGVTAAFVLVSRITGQANQVAGVAARLAAGHIGARTGMTPTDEINAVGHSLDQYADAVDKAHDTMQEALRRQRREINHLLTVFEGMPDGVVVQDLDGRVVIINEQARQLLGTQRVFRSTRLHELSEVVTEQLGEALAPGIYALGDPHRVHLDEKVLSAQAAAVIAATEQRLGTVIILRDITNDVRKERERDAMLEQLTKEIQEPLSMLARAAATSSSGLVNLFAKEIAQQSVALQKMILDMRELANIDVASIKRRQRPLNLETLVWAIANEWRQVARANDLTLKVIIEDRGQYILGDEKRLCWAIGNIIDNSIKYTLPGGAVSLEIKPEGEGLANLRIRDNGVGVLETDSSYIFTRFYRGTPTGPDGQVIRIPGMGQGLYIARQIVDSHGGSIRMKSSPEIGTAVFISLPLTSRVGLDLTHFHDMDGETQQLSESLLVDLDEQSTP